MATTWPKLSSIVPDFSTVDTELDGVRWLRILPVFEGLNPVIIVPVHGEPGGIEIARALALHIETVRAHIQALTAAGMSPERIVADYKPMVIAAKPTWYHPQLIDLELRYGVVG